jgi:tight adherence protein C
VTAVLIALCAGAGIGLFVTGLPPLDRSRRLRRRVEPYLIGLRGRPSGLLGPGAGGRSPVGSWIDTRLNTVRPGAGAAMAERLAAAGRRRSVAEFRVEQLTYGVAAGVTATAALIAAGDAMHVSVDSFGLLVFSLIAFACGWFGRDWLLGRTIGVRKSEMQEELPTAIDLVTLSIMAGESVPAAFERVARVMGGGIGREFKAVIADVHAGASAIDALESLKNRLPDYGVVRFVDALCTGIERGAPLADVLRAQADDAREARRRRLMELGGRREVVMLLPVVFLIMPVVVVFALLPGLVSLDLLVP